LGAGKKRGQKAIKRGNWSNYDLREEISKWSRSDREEKALREKKVEKGRIRSPPVGAEKAPR